MGTPWAAVSVRQHCTQTYRPIAYNHFAIGEKQPDSCHSSTGPDVIEKSIVGLFVVVVVLVQLNCNQPMLCEHAITFALHKQSMGQGKAGRIMYWTTTGVVCG